MKFSKIFLLSLLLFFILGCSNVVIHDKTYYLLEFNQELEEDELSLDKPLPYSVFVQDSQIPRLYDRNKIVERRSQNVISFLEYEVWAQRLSESVPNYIADKIYADNVFQSVNRKSITDKVDYTILTKIKNIDFVKYVGQQSAQIQMEMILKKPLRDEVILRYIIDKEKKLYEPQTELFVEKINQILMEETYNFNKYCVEYLSDDKKQRVVRSGSEEEAKKTTEKIIVSETESDLLSLGRLYMPALTETDLEPAYEIFSSNWIKMRNAQMGEDVLLEPGEYNLLFGSGIDEQKMRKRVEIKPQFRTVVKPDWGGLVVNLIDENRNSLDYRYEIFDLESNESYGTGSGVQEELGEQLKTWILPTSKYKITVNGQPFNTYTDFTTIDLDKGEVKELTLVLDSETAELRGAGELIVSERSQISKYTKISSAIHANANVTSNNETDKDDPVTNMTLTAQFDNKLEYDQFPYQFISKNLIELGTTKDSETDFRVASDDFSLKNTFVYYFSHVLGTYVRADVNTHFFETKTYSSEETNYKMVDKDGNASYYHNKTEQRVKSPFFPLNFKEGIGFNLRLLNTSKNNFNIRAGFGLRQDFNNNVYSYESQVTEDSLSYDLYKENESLYQEGMEFSLVSSFQLPYRVILTSNADILFPFDKKEALNIEWENIFNIKLIRQLSVDYKVDLQYNKDNKDYVVFDQTLYLRLTYFIY